LALRGDSMTALTWAVTERPIVINASTVWTLLCVATNIDVIEYTHIPGDVNINCDRLSRRDATPGMTVREEATGMGIEGGVVIEVNEDETIMRLLRLCACFEEIRIGHGFLEVLDGREGCSQHLHRSSRPAHTTYAHSSWMRTDPFF
jgi:hypothetical protein